MKIQVTQEIVDEPKYVFTVKTDFKDFDVILNSLSVLLVDCDEETFHWFVNRLMKLHADYLDEKIRRLLGKPKKKNHRNG